VSKLYVVLAVVAAVATALPKALKAVAPAFKGDRPDITPAMVLAAVKFVCVQAIALSLMTPGTETYILQVAGTVVPVALMIADFALRSARNKAEVAKVFVDQS
jgi:hypothetical protein